MNELKNRLRLISREIFPKKRVVRISKLKKEASSRDFYRIFLSSDMTCVAMVLDKSDDKEIIDNIIQATSVFMAYKINVPSIYRVFRKECILVVKDAGPISLERFKVQTGRKKHLLIYKKIIDSLLKIHNFPVSDKIKNLSPFKKAFTMKKFISEFEFFLKYIPLSYMISSEEKDVLREIFNDVSKKLVNDRYVLTHRDLHARNIHINNKDDFYLIDHQDARMGPYLYDLVSLLKDSYVNLDHNIETELVSYYLNQSLDVWGIKIDSKQFFLSYYRTIFQRSVKACGTFYYQSTCKNMIKYEKSIPIVLNYALNALDKLDIEIYKKEIVRTILQKLL